ncbi:DUF222 domain-containing protein [Saccharomonospora sp. NPDC006951]
MELAQSAELLWKLGDRELAALLADRESALRQAHADMLAALGEAERRGLAKNLGYRDSVAMLRTELRVSAREAHARLADAMATQARRSSEGKELPAPLLATARVLNTGGLGREHLREITRIFARCPDTISEQERADAERTLLDLAAQASPEAVRTAGHRLIAYWDSEREPAEESELATPTREFRYRYRRNGQLEFTGSLDPETGATLEGLFGPLAKPRPKDDDGHPDPRTMAQRHGDALAEIIESAARAEDLAVQGGERAVLTATITLAELEDRTRQSSTELPGYSTPEQLRRLACEAQLVPAIFGTDGEVLYLGRSSRHASKAQRRALALRDKGCAFPGCDRGPKWCVPHHIVWWDHGGNTDVDSMVLVCAHHHRLIHHTDWEVRVSSADRQPEFIPPAWLDPARRPRRNRAHLIGKHPRAA